MPCTMYMWGAFIVLSSYPQTEVATAVMLEEAVCGDGHHCMELKSICWKSYTFPTTNHGKLSSKTIFPPQTETHKCQNGIYPGSDKNIHIFLSVFLLLLFSEHIAMRINTNATYKHAHTHKKKQQLLQLHMHVRACMWRHAESERKKRWSMLKNSFWLHLKIYATKSNVQNLYILTLSCERNVIRWLF